MLTRQELIYLAMGARLLARQSRDAAGNQAWYAVREIHLAAAKTYDELAGKCERLAKEAPG